MSSHPLNLMFRFFLEVAALIVSGIWAWHLSDTVFSYLLAVAVPIFMAIVWGVFAVPNDPSRSGKTIVKTPGLVRLILELAFFGFSSWAMLSLGWELASWTFATGVLLHYLLSFDRIQWLLKQ